MADHPEPDTKPNGDYIAAHVGENARNVVVGKNVVQIGALQIPYYLAAIIALCLLIGLGFIAYPSVKPWLPKPLAFPPAAQNETLILIATFQVTEGNYNTLAHREIRDKIRAKIQELHEANLRAEVEPTVLNSDQQDAAKQLGEKYKASMVIWGDDTGARVTVNFLNLRQPDFDAASVTISETARSQLANPSAYVQFITDDLPREMSFFALFAVGQAYFANKQYDHAITSIEAAIVQLPPMAVPTGLAEAYFRLGWLYQEATKQSDQVIANYTKALKFKPDDAGIYNNRGIARYTRGQMTEAIADLDQALKLKPDFVGVYVNRGNIHKAQGQIAEAIADYDQALKLTPNLAEAYNNRGNAHKVQGQIAEAIADYDQALKLKPDYAEAYYNRGSAHYAQSQVAEAIADYDQALKLKPDYAEAYISRGNARADQGNYIEAIADYDQVLKLYPSDAKVYYNRGNVHKMQGQMAEAIADYGQALKLKPNLVEAYNNRGTVRADQGNYIEAIADYDQALKLKPNYAEAYNNRGTVRAEQGNYIEAIADYDQVLKLDPGYAEAYYNRGGARYAQKYLVGALADYRRYLQILHTIDDRTQVEQRIAEIESALAKQK